MKTNYIKAWRLLPCLLISPLGLYAQEAPGSVDDENVVELSPFEVTGDSDVGYQATSTLAGTRLRTELRDLGSSISIVNEEFMNDTASVNLEDVLVFTPNTEVGGMGGNFSGGGLTPALQRGDPSGGVTRIRGLASADLTRDYFISSVPFDTFNTDRVDVQRGANSALYGLGSPGGIVNASTIKADFLGNRGRVRLETDQYGSLRASARYNVMAGDVLAVRVAALRDDKQFEQKQAFLEDDRVFATVTAKLPLGLTLRGGYEHAERLGASPDHMPPNDGITPWINMGKPIVATPSDGGRIFRTSDMFAPGTANNSFMQLAIPNSSSGLSRFYQDPSNPDPTWGGPVFIRAGQGLDNPWANATPSTTGEWMNLLIWPETQIIRRSGHYSDGTPVAAGTAPFFVSGHAQSQITDRSIFDYRKNLFSGGTAQQNAEWDVYTASLEGNYFDNRLGFTASYHEEDFYSSDNNSLQGDRERTIYIDPNAYLLGTTDGTANGPLIPNPNFGRPVIGGESAGNSTTNNRDAIRFQGYGELRFNDFMDDDSWVTKLLGKFTLTGLVEETSHYNQTIYSARNGDPMDIATVAQYTTGGDLNNPNASLNQSTGQLFALPVGNDMNFLNVTSINDLSGANIGGVPFGRQRSQRNGNQITTVQGWDGTTGTFNTFDARIYTIWEDRENAYRAASHANKTLSEVDSEVFVGQHQIWDNTVILTGTWRSDVARSAGIGAPTLIRNVEDTLDPVYQAGVPQPLPQTADAETTSYSIMVHTPPFLRDRLPFELSVYKSSADNFIPTGGNVTIFNDTVGAVAGVTEEKGFIIEALDGKLSARFNWFESGVVNQRIENGSLYASETVLRGLAHQLENPANTAQGFTAADSQAVLPPQGVIDMNGFQVDWNNPSAATTNRNPSDTGTQDFTSEGMEVEIAYNPIPAWTLLLTVGQQETITSNTYPEMVRYMNEHVIPQWVNSSFAQNFFINDDASQTLAQYAQTSIVEVVNRTILEDGNPQSEQAEWRWAFNTSYSFGNAEFIPNWLGDLTVGGGVRWQDKVGIGFGVGPNEFGELDYDLNQPFYADATMYVDVFARMRYKLSDNRSFALQINIKDLANNDGLVPIVAQPDGSEIYRITEGRLISLSGTFEF